MHRHLTPKLHSHLFSHLFILVKMIIAKEENKHKHKKGKLVYKKKKSYNK